MTEICKLILGIAEAFVLIGHLEFMYDQAPESMRSTSTALFWMSISAGSYISTMSLSQSFTNTAHSPMDPIGYQIISIEANSIISTGSLHCSNG